MRKNSACIRVGFAVVFICLVDCLQATAVPPAPTAEPGPGLTMNNPYAMPAVAPPDGSAAPSTNNGTSISTILPLRTAPVAEAAPPMINPFSESMWYARVDYFHWNERAGGCDFDNESGALYTLGYQHRAGNQQFRVEGFATRADYNGGDQNGEPSTGTTDYAGVRGEYDFLFDSYLSPRITWLVGVGTRVWMRSLSDGVTTITNSPVIGYNEAWATLYPYIGFETRRNPDVDFEWFATGRVGVTAYTFEYESYDDAVLHPKPGMMGRLETGFRGRRFNVSGYIEAMSWAQSSPVMLWGTDNNNNYQQYPVLQPASIMLTAGIRAGITF